MVSYREHPCCLELSPWIECYWHLRAEGSGCWEPIYPDGCPEIILNLGEPARELVPGGLQPAVDRESRPTRPLSRRQPRSFVHGQLERCLWIRNAPVTEVWGIRLRPWGLPALTGARAGRLTQRAVDLTDLSPRLERTLRRVLDLGLEGDRRVACELDTALAAWLRLHEPRSLRTTGLAHLLLREPATPLDRALRATGWSARSAQRHFRDEVGLSPKQFGRISRFVRFQRLLEERSLLALSDLAVASGYYDQAHLHRDLRCFTATTPARFRERSTTTFDLLYGQERLARLVPSI